jgi:hypothetical protein
VKPRKRWEGIANVFVPAASKERQARRSKRAHLHIWRLSLFRQLMCPSTGP